MSIKVIIIPMHFTDMKVWDHSRLILSLLIINLVIDTKDLSIGMRTVMLFILIWNVIIIRLIFNLNSLANLLLPDCFEGLG